MTNWKKYTIQSAEKSSSYIKLKLDGYVNFTDAYNDYIYCVNTSPFSNWEVGYQIEIDNDATKYRKYIDNIGSATIVRISADNQHSLMAMRSRNRLDALTRRVEEVGDVELEYKIEEGKKPDGTYYNSHGWTYRKR